MRLLYIAPVYISLVKPDGVAKKVLHHYNVFEKYYDAHLGYYGDEGVVVVHGADTHIVPYDGRHRRYALYEEMETLAKSNRIEKVYIRYPQSDFKFIRLVKSLKAMHADIAIEIPTYPYNLEKPASNAQRFYMIKFVDSILRRTLFKYVGRIITYSDDHTIWDIPCIKTLNGIDFEKVAPRVPDKHEGISLISCAHYYDVHGCDRLVKGIYEYYKGGGNREIVFHIVGIGAILSKYKKLVKNYKLENHIVFHGYQTGKDLDELYNGADIGINSLAIHRLGLKKESTLKTKEYAAKGLPIVSSYEIDCFTKEDHAKFVCLVPLDDTALNIEDIISFYDELYGQNDSALELSRTIRKKSKAICDMENTLKPVIEYFNRNGVL